MGAVSGCKNRTFLKNRLARDSRQASGCHSGSWLSNCHLLAQSLLSVSVWPVKRRSPELEGRPRVRRCQPGPRDAGFASCQCWCRSQDHACSCHPEVTLKAAGLTLVQQLEGDEEVSLGSRGLPLLRAWSPGAPVLLSASKQGPREGGEAASTPPVPCVRTPRKPPQRLLAGVWARARVHSAGDAPRAAVPWSASACFETRSRSSPAMAWGSWARDPAASAF